VGFSLVPGIGRTKLARLESYFGVLENARQVEPADLRQYWLDSASIRPIGQWCERSSLDADMEKLERCQVREITYHDAGYPARLKEIYDYPPLLYVRGSLLPEDEWCLAVVGTRQSTVYGRQVAEEIVAVLAIMELKRLIKQVGTMKYLLAREARQKYRATFD
jgi:DNA processing protein